MSQYIERNNIMDNFYLQKHFTKRDDNIATFFYNNHNCNKNNNNP